MERRVTIKDIAAEIGVHHSTVSRALRDDPQIAPATRALITEAALRLGYAPDPMLRALALYRSSLHPVPQKETLAFIWPEQTRSVVARSPYLQRYFRGAQTRAVELGFALDVFHLREHRPAALERILRARGIRGVIVGVFEEHREVSFNFPLGSFASAAVGGALQSPALHRVSHDHYQAVRIALRNIAALGYRRISFAVAEGLEEAVDSRYSMSFLAHHPLGSKEAAGLLYVGPTTDRELARFVAATKPEALVTTYSLVLGSPFLRRPDGSALAHVSLDVISGLDPHSGIDQLTEFNAANAVDLVAEQVLHGTSGLPAVQKKVLSDGTWISGSTCPPLARGN
jgi:LacI family transcriptional regulator